MTGLFVAFEGGEGAGKSTQVALLDGWLRANGITARLTREPGATPAGERIRAIVLDPASSLSPRAEALLYAADRAHHVETVVRPVLAAGGVVISDRYVDSSLAYQGAGRSLAVADVRQVSDWATGGLLPHLTVVLDIDPAAGLARAAGHGSPDRIEQESVHFHERVRAGFRELAGADPDRYLVLDGSAEPGDVAAAVRDRVALLLGDLPEAAEPGAEVPAEPAAEVPAEPALPEPTR
ncbi:MAG: dTMP kinase [Geodermatophilaceae bacterium]